MRQRHPERELIAYMRDELAPPDRERVADHLQACADCRRTEEAFREALNDLGRSVPPPPAIHWGRYRAELRAKLEDRVHQGRRDRWGWWLRPVPLTVGAGLAGILLLFGIQSSFREARLPHDLTAFEETLVGGKLDLLRQYSLLEHLDLLEDLDVIRNLDRLGSREG